MAANYALMEEQGHAAAERAGTYQGRRYSRFVVRVVNGEMAATHQVYFYPVEAEVTVLARNSREAVQYVRNLPEFATAPCRTFSTRGPRGGRYEEYQGWYSATGRAMSGMHRASNEQQLTLRG